MILAVVSQKGGVGKTTTAVNLAAALARNGAKVLLVDTDPQGAVRHALGLRGAQARAGIAELLNATRQFGNAVRPTPFARLHVLLAGAVTESADHGAYHTAFAQSPAVREMFGLAAAHGYTVVVDTPPGLGGVTRRVLSECDSVLVPLQAEPLALQTSSQILRGIREAARDGVAPTLEGFVLTMYDDTSAMSKRVADTIRAQLPAPLLLDVVIPRTEATIEAFAAGQPVVVRSPDDAAAKAYMRLAELLTKRDR
ncbi:MAG: Cobyrinic acid ac-diamide synthase [Gemmatimonadetes bacterium]|nr:Cobyrinic acid ac-diamide synthase [Gemmatimonadota bacterium]